MTAPLIQGASGAAGEKLTYATTNENNKEIFLDIIDLLKNNINQDSSSEDIQTLLYEIGKKHQFQNLKDFFKLVYQVLLGQEQGPRLGSFIKIFGIRETIDYIENLIDN